MPSKPETRIQELHLTLPPVPKPVAKYKPTVRVGNMLYVSGHGPLKEDKSMITGKVGKDSEPRARKGRRPPGRPGDPLHREGHARFARQGHPAGQDARAGELHGRLQGSAASDQRFFRVDGRRVRRGRRRRCAQCDWHQLAAGEHLRRDRVHLRSD